MREPERMTGGVALSFPINDDEATVSISLSSSSSKAPPPRLRKRLLLEPKSPLSADDIDAKLREANLRRQVSFPALPFLSTHRSINICE